MEENTRGQRVHRQGGREEGIQREGYRGKGRGIEGEKGSESSDWLEHKPNILHTTHTVPAFLYHTQV